MTGITAPATRNWAHRMGVRTGNDIDRKQEVESDRLLVLPVKE